MILRIKIQIENLKVKISFKGLISSISSSGYYFLLKELANLLNLLNLLNKKMTFLNLQSTNPIFARKLKFSAKSHPLYQFIRPFSADVDVVLQQRV